MKKRHHHKKHHGGMRMMMRDGMEAMHDKMDMMNDMDHMERIIHREKKMGAEHYAGYDPRRRQEMRDAGMIHEDHHALANLPQQPIMKYYSTEGYMPEGLDDTIRGIDNQMMADNPVRKGIFKPHKY